MYIIIKHVKRKNGKMLPVVMIDSNSEVLEFEKKEKAEDLVNILNANTDSGHFYQVKKV